MIKDLFNTSLETSLLPDLWKLARVAPSYKEGDKADKVNCCIKLFQPCLSSQSILKKSWATNYNSIRMLAITFPLGFCAFLQL